MPGSERVRADVALLTRGLAESREKGRALIEAGLVYARDQRVEKPSQRISADAPLEVRGGLHPYVGRGGIKLARALDAFGIDPCGAVCVDVGASTGGFADVLLQRGASRVYAVDVGSGQLDARIRENPRVTPMERVNARTLEPGMFRERPALVVIDVSFISVTLILPAIARVLRGAGRIVALIKPQFEAGRGKLGKRGVITDPAIHADVLRAIVNFAPSVGWRVSKLTCSPIAGAEGNIEFFAELLPAGAGVDGARVLEVVAEAHSAAR